MLENSFIDACLCVDFGVDGCDKTVTFGNDAVSETTLGAGAGWGSTTVDCGVNYYGGVG